MYTYTPVYMCIYIYNGCMMDFLCSEQRAFLRRCLVETCTRRQCQIAFKSQESRRPSSHSSVASNAAACKVPAVLLMKKTPSNDNTDTLSDTSDTSVVKNADWSDHRFWSSLITFPILKSSSAIHQTWLLSSPRRCRLLVRKCEMTPCSWQAWRALAVLLYDAFCIRR